MKKLKLLILSVSHLLAIFIGFAGGIYALPILIAPPSPDSSELSQKIEQSEFVGQFSPDRQDSDGLHWGEGTFAIGQNQVSFVGKISPGPDFRLYLSPQFIETEAEFKRLKSTMTQVGDVKTFENFVVAMDGNIDPENYNTVIIWCESFGEFITSGRYQKKVN